jgi:hypothetical protein
LAACLLFDRSGNDVIRSRHLPFVDVNQMNVLKAEELRLSVLCQHSIASPNFVDATDSNVRRISIS